MTADYSSLEPLIKRTSLTISFDEFQSVVEKQYPSIGSIIKCEPILLGYESANFILTTQQGKFVLKVFETDRDPQNIKDLVRVQIEAQKAGVPVLKFVEGIKGVLSQIQQEKQTVWYFLTHQFVGSSFEDHYPNLDQMKIVADYMAKLNTLDFSISESYDSWGNKNLVKEFDENIAVIPVDVKKKIEHIIDKIRHIQFEKLPKSVVHGDMQRKHVLSDAQGNLCVIDFGCMSYTARIIDVSTFIAWFCLCEQNVAEWNSILTSVIEVYEKLHKLTFEERESLFLFVRASYAAYFLKTSLLIQSGDQSEETKTWNDQASRMLDLTESFV